MRTPLPLLGGRHVDRVAQVNNERSVNWYAEQEPGAAKSLVTMKPTPGLVRVGAAGNGPCRSHRVTFDGKAYWVSGPQLMSQDTSGAITAIGSLNTSSGWCVLAAGRDYLLVVDGGDGYTWNGVTFATVADADFPASPSWCAYMDGYFIVNDDDTDRFHISDLPGGAENPTSWTALNFATAEADPDDAVAVIATYETVYLVGTRTTQLYYNSGNSDFPFTLHTNGIMEWGTDAPASIAEAEGTLFMLARTTAGGLAVLMVQRFQARPIASDDLLYTFDRYTTTSDAEGYAYRMGGQTFYVLTFPSEDVTFVYHVETGLWHERQSDGLGRHRSRGHGFFNGRHYVGDYETGEYYYLSPTTYADNGATVIRKRITSIVHRDRRDLEVNEFEVEFAPGVGLTSGQGSDPQAVLRYSVDGGKTWSSEMWQPIGAIGDYTRRAVWRQLGQGRQFTFEITVSDPVEAVIVAVYADIVPLAA